MLDPSGIRKKLPEFLLRHGTDIALLIEQDTAVACRSGIQCHNVLPHIFSPLKN
jgi:hypothetical protein